MCRILGIDYGERRIGIAISDPTCTIASPLMVIDTKKEDPLEVIARLCKEYKIRKVVMGLPLLMSGEEGRVASLVRKFKAELEKVVGVDIVLVDERFTSKVSMRELKSRKKKVKKEDIDLFSAAYLLQEYLNSHGCEED